MNNAITFRIAFAILFAAVVLVRMFFHRKAKTFGANVRSPTERSLTAVLRLALGIPFMLSIAAYLFVPPWIDWANVGLPTPLRWFGFLLGAAMVGALYWVHHVLGQNFSPTLQIKQNHRLVIRGPYRWVRHPMYTIMLALHIGYFLVTANWLVGLLGLAVIGMVMVLRTPAEEAMMLAEFGDEYRLYMAHSGRFLPSWSTVEHTSAPLPTNER